MGLKPFSDMETDEPRAAVGDAERQITSIRRRIFSRVLPLIVVPIIILGLLSVLAIALIQSRTDSAVAAAEEAITEQVVEAAVTRASESAARELSDYVSAWIKDVEVLSTRDDVGIEISEGTAEVTTRRLGGVESTEELREALTGEAPLTGRLLVRALKDELSDDFGDPEVTLISRQGIEVATSAENSPPALVANQRWFTEAMDSGVSFVELDMSTGTPSMVFTARSELFAAANVVGAVQVRVPMTSVQNLLDQVIADSGENLNAVLLDRAGSVLLADTANDHDPATLFSMAMVQSSDSLELQLLNEGTFEGNRSLFAANNVNVDELGNQLRWLVQTRQPIGDATASLDEVRSVSADAGQTRDLVFVLLLALLFVVLVVGYASARGIAARITDPLTHLSDQAQTVAASGIPAVVEAAKNSDEALPTLPPFEVETNDELSLLADSLNVMQDAAVDLASGQVQLRRQNVSRTFVSLGRRNQNLLNRQLEFIDELERSESDPDTLQNLFRLDHLATRMRRNAENLLVLAGEQTPRRWVKPIAIRDVLRAAASEIGDYQRVRIGDIDAVTVSGGLATDLSHLLAELLENAGSFSPPNSPIDVLGQLTPTHYRLAIIDQGIGLDDDSLAQANQRLANPVDFSDAPSAYLGLFVVGHLARQLNIRVRLARSDAESGSRTGTIAFVDLPVEVLSSETPNPIEVPRDADAPKAAAAPAPAPVAEETPAPAAAASAPPIPEAPPVPTAEPLAPVAERPVEQTAAGFPKRVAPMVAGTASAADVGVTAAGFPKRRSAEPAAEVPGPSETTAAGFPKRRSGNSASTAITPPPTPIPDAAPPTPRRSADEVSSSLRSFRAAVARGRADSGGPGVEAPSAPASQPPTAVAPAPVPPPIQSGALPAPPDQVQAPDSPRSE
jgi:HAMP domain-containing protein